MVWSLSSSSLGRKMCPFWEERESFSCFPQAHMKVKKSFFIQKFQREEKGIQSWCNKALYFVNKFISPLTTHHTRGRSLMTFQNPPKKDDEISEQWLNSLILNMGFSLLFLSWIWDQSWGWERWLSKVQTHISSLKLSSGSSLSLYLSFSWNTRIWVWNCCVDMKTF